MSYNHSISASVHLDENSDLRGVCYKVSQNGYAVEIGSVTFFGTQSQLAELFANAINALNDPR